VNVHRFLGPSWFHTRNVSAIATSELRCDLASGGTPPVTGAHVPAVQVWPSGHSPLGEHGTFAGRTGE